MSAHPEILTYIASSREKGFSDEAIQTALLNAGWHKRDIIQAFSSEQEHSQKMSPFVILFSIFLFLVFGGGAAYGLYWYQNQPVPTPTPVINPSITPTIRIADTEPMTPQPSVTQESTISAQISSEISFAHNAFGFSVLQELLKKKDTMNIVISPTSIALALSMTYNGASDSTKLSMANTLKINKIDNKKLNEDSATLIKLLSNPDPQITLSFANSIWTRKGVSFLPEFLNVNKTYYNAEIQSLDFSLPSAADTINAWVQKNTKGKIPTIVEKPIDTSIVMYLINAIYFYGTWTHEFDATLTQMKPFMLPDNSKIQHLLMKQERNDYLYQETNTFQAIQLPYGKNKQLSMIIMLPKATLSAFLNQLTQATWNSWMKSFSEMEGTVLLPKFKIEYKTSLKNTLLALGMVPAFSSETANFSRMRKQKDVFISDVIHKTFIDVNEKGTEAAAATAVVMMKTSMAEPKKTFLMEVNKPFFFAITDTTSNEILFMGVINNPAM
jgi:serpin B